MDGVPLPRFGQLLSGPSGPDIVISTRGRRINCRQLYADATSSGTRPNKASSVGSNASSAFSSIIWLKDNGY